MRAIKCLHTLLYSVMQGFENSLLICQLFPVRLSNGRLGRGSCLPISHLLPALQTQPSTYASVWLLVSAVESESTVRFAPSPHLLILGSSLSLRCTGMFHGVHIRGIRIQGNFFLRILKIILSGHSGMYVCLIISVL